MLFYLNLNLFCFKNFNIFFSKQINLQRECLIHIIIMYIIDYLNSINIHTTILWADILKQKKLQQDLWESQTMNLFERRKKNIKVGSYQSSIGYAYLSVKESRNSCLTDYWDIRFQWLNTSYDEFLVCI